jgi:hypothetical protein
MIGIRYPRIAQRKFHESNYYIHTVFQRVLLLVFAQKKKLPKPISKAKERSAEE